VPETRAGLEASHQCHFHLFLLFEETVSMREFESLFLGVPSRSPLTDANWFLLTKWRWLAIGSVYFEPIESDGEFWFPLPAVPLLLKPLLLLLVHFSLVMVDWHQTFVRSWVKQSP